MDKPFIGEVMRCKICGREQKSDINIESGWTAVDLEGDNGQIIRFYICNRHKF